MFKIIIIPILLTLLSHAYGPVLKTGQTQSYDADGNVVTDGSVKDDGYYKKGKARSYSRSAAGVVTDNVTGLEWQDDYSDNGGSIKSADWQGALDYCAALGLDDGEWRQWRLPSRKELVGLRDLGRLNPAIDPKFTKVTSGYYWSSTTYGEHTSYAWVVDFNGGLQYGYGKSDGIYVRCVRSRQPDL